MNESYITSPYISSDPKLNFIISFTYDHNLKNSSQTAHLFKI